MTGVVRRPFVIALAALAASCVSLLAASRAEAGYPGKLGVIAFDSDFSDLGGDSKIFTMPPTGGPPYAQLTFNQNDDDPAYSGDGRRIVWEGETDPPAGGDDEIFIMNADGSGQTQLTPSSNTNLFDEDPAISWDGKRIVFEREDPNAPFDDEIFIMNADGSGQTRLTNNTTDDQDPVFSRDGKRIYYEGEDAEGDTQVFVMNADGSGQTPLTSAVGQSEDVDVSPDDRRIVFTSDRADQVNFTGDVWIMNADGSGQTKITSVPSGDFADRPVFSPDGKKIVFDQNGPSLPDSEIFAMNADGSGLVPLTNDNALQDSADWQPIPVSCDGRQATLVGTEGPDTIVGTAAADVIAGLGGKDKLSGLGGKDRICGGKGKDVLKGGGGNDRLFGQAGKDKLIAGKGKKDSCVGGKSKDTAKGCEKENSV